MINVVVFGGATEGRKLCEICAEYAIPMRYCVATADGARPAEGLSNTDVSVGRLGVEEMTALLRRDRPALVIDATHPYAEEGSRNITAACRDFGVPLLRVIREGAEERSCVYFDGMDELLACLEREPGNIFVTAGSSSAEAFTKLPDHRRRVWLRILPSLESLRCCLDLGYGSERIICMQGPFSEALNRAMFKDANARILVTKDSGAVGGLPEKVSAAQSLGMLTAVLARPKETGGISLEEARRKIMELRT